jgi:hypothetical protein
MDVEDGRGLQYFFRSSGNTGGQVANFHRLNAQQGFQFGAKLRSDLPFGHDALTLTGWQVDKFVKQKADLMIHGTLQGCIIIVQSYPENSTLVA